MKEKEKIVEINNGESHRVLELAMEAGRILLRNGAEIFRVEETVWHICEHYGVQGLDTFVLSNGIFITADDGREDNLCKNKACAIVRCTFRNCSGGQCALKRDCRRESQCR